MNVLSIFPLDFANKALFSADHKSKRLQTSKIYSTFLELFIDTSGTARFTS